MQTFLLLTFVLFTVAQIYCCLRFARNGFHLYVKATIISYGFFAAFLIAKYVFHWSIPELILILVMLTIFTHTFFGYYLGFYQKSKPFDRFLHGFGTFSFALFVYELLTNLMVAGGSKLFRAIYVAALGIAAGTLFELFEYMADRKHHTKSQKGLIDTDTDMVANVIGGIAAAVVAYCFYL